MIEWRGIVRSAIAPSVFLATIFVFAAGSADAQNPSWCAIMDNDGTTQCAYSSQQQCLETVRGIGGECILNPAGSAPQSAPTQPFSENAQGLLPLQLQDPGPPPGVGARPPNN